MYDNNLVGYQNQYVHYETNTNGGSSRSPVLNRQLQVFAFHHSTEAETQVNAGVLFESIREALNLNMR